MPGATIGILGGGQLGRMFAITARKMGYRVYTYEPHPDSPTGQVADVEINRPYTDAAALRDFAQAVDVITYEFENIPVEALEPLAQIKPLHPSPTVLHICQNRRREKEFLQQQGFPVAPFRVVQSLEELKQGVIELGTPCVLKTADFGYDGKGQQKIGATEDLAKIWQQHGLAAGVLEQWVDFEVECSVVVARTRAGEIKAFPVGLNHHENHILATTEVPAPLASILQEEAQSLASRIAGKLGLVGLLAVEFFVTREGKLIVNELAPRPHNSGHYSFGACVTSQFEQQLRAVCGLPLGETTLLRPVLMRNLLGDVWKPRTPEWEKLLALPGLQLHLYGKSEARPGRKMGHYCILADSLESARAIDQQALEFLR